MWIMRYTGKKAKCWQVIRQICKVRDGDQCYTCPRNGDELTYDAGHYRPVAVVGSNNTRAWDPRFIRRQCKTCNGPGQGEQAIFRANLIKELGEAPVAEYDRLVRAKQVSPVRNWDVLLEDLTRILETERAMNFA